MNFFFKIKIFVKEQEIRIFLKNYNLFSKIINIQMMQFKKKNINFQKFIIRF